MLSRADRRVEVPEGRLAAGLARRCRGATAELEMGSYPAFRLGSGPFVIVIRGTEAARLASAVEELKGIMRSLGGEPMEEVAA